MSKPATPATQPPAANAVRDDAPAHTPGPWHVYGNGHCIGAKDGGVGLFAMMVRTQGEIRANAQLCAAAPDMHGALTPFADLDGEGDEDLPDDTPVTIKFGRTTIAVACTLGDLRRARAAIAKARGAA